MKRQFEAWFEMFIICMKRSINSQSQNHQLGLRRRFWKKAAHTFLGGLDCIVLAGKEIIGKSSVRVGGGEEVAGVLEAGVPFPPARIKTATELGISISKVYIY